MFSHRDNWLADVIDPSLKPTNDELNSLAIGINATHSEKSIRHTVINELKTMKDAIEDPESKTHLEINGQTVIVWKNVEKLFVSKNYFFERCNFIFSVEDLKQKNSNDFFSFSIL